MFLAIVIYHTRKSGLAILCSAAVSTVGLGGSIGPIFNEIRLRSRMKEAAKLQQMRFVSAPKEKQGPDDIEDIIAFYERDSTTLSREDDGGDTLL